MAPVAADGSPEARKVLKHVASHPLVTSKERCSPRSRSEPGGSGRAVNACSAVEGKLELRRYPLAGKR